jgi:hypothetical protein
MIRDLLWWTGATAGKEVVLVDDGVSFREREGTVVTNAWFVPQLPFSMIRSYHQER